jgi:hypothetical protein
MSVRKDERNEGRLALSTLARDHAVYVIQITKNENIFKPEYSEVSAGLVKEATAIFHCIWGANNVLVNDKQTYEIRRKYQELAATHCNIILADIAIARKLFHLSHKRVKYWTNTVVEIRNKTRGWTTSDAKRYAQYR